MAKLPQIVNDQDIGASSLNTGTDFYRPIQGNEDVGKGLESLGKGVATVGEAVLDEEARVKAKAEAQAKSDQNTYLQSQLLTYSDTLQQEALNRQQDMPVGGFGYAEDFTKYATDQASDTITKNFADYPDQGKVALEFTKVRDQYVRQATVTEYGARTAWRSQVTDQTVANLSASIAVDPDNFENAKSQFLDYTSKSFAGQDNVRPQIEQLGLHKLAVAEAQSIAARDPTGFRTAFNGAFVNQPAAASAPHITGIVDAANNNQLNPSVLLGIAKIESGIDPNIGPNSKSSAAGMWQILNDPATLNAIGISAKDRTDPTIATPHVAAYLAGIRDDIEASGQQATPGKIYMAYNLGPGMSAAVRNANPNTPIENIVASVYGNRGPAFVNQILSNNPSLYKPGMTAGQVVNNYEAAMTKATSDTAGYLTGQNVTTDEQAHSLFASAGVKGAEYLNANDAAQIFTETNAKIGQATEEQQKLTRGVAMLNGDLVGDRYATKDQDAVDEVVAKANLSKGVASGDPNALSGMRARTEAVGFIPLPDINGLREAINGGGQTPNKLAAYAALTDIATNNQGAYDASKIPTDERGRVNEYRAYTEGLLLSPADAVKRIDEQRTPQGQQMKQAMAKQFEGNKGELAQLSFSDIQNHFDGPWTPFSSPAAVDDRVQALALDSYRTGYQYWRQQGQDADASKALALKDMDAHWGVSNLNTANRGVLGRVTSQTQTLMPFAPEKVFSPVGGSWDYITEQAQNVVATAAMFGRIPDYYGAVKRLIPGGTEGLSQNGDILALADKMTSADGAGMKPIADKVWNLSAGVAADKDAGEADLFKSRANAPPIQLVPRAETAEDAQIPGKPLRYMLAYQKPDGTKEIIPGTWFTPNYTLAQQQYEAAFKQKNDDAVKAKATAKPLESPTAD